MKQPLDWLPQKLAMALSVAVLLSACATTDRPLALPPIGPPPRTASHGPEGALQVFTATTTISSGGIEYFPHTSYRVYHPDGRFVKFVVNHAGETDQAPQRVPLPKGDYYVIAQSEGYGVVKVPVVIKGSQLTGVYLDRTIMKEAKQAKPEEVVRFPNSWTIGWKAETNSTP